MKIYFTLARHKWKEVTRSKVFNKNLALSIIMGFFIVYLILNLVFIGIFLDRIILKVFPDTDPVNILNGFLIYYFFFDLITRFMIQDIPVLSVQSYFHLNVNRNKLFHFILIKALGSLFNVIPLIVFIPFALRTFPVYYNGDGIYQWLIALFLIMLSLNYLIFYFKKQITSNPWTRFLFIGILGILFLIDKYGIFDVTGMSSDLFNSFIENPYYLIFPLITVFLFYYLNYRYLKSKIYPEEMNISTEKKFQFSGDISLLKRFDQLGDLITLEIKMLIRHKRTRGILFLSPLFVLYGLMFYTNDAYDDMMGMYVFVGIMISGMFVLSYGQFMSGWEGSHFDKLLSERISTFNYYYAKLWLFWIVCTFMFILSVPYFLYSWKIVLINLMALFFNLGVTPVIVFYFSLHNYKKIDMKGSAAFNWQGMSGKQFIMMIPIIVIPLLIYLPFSLAGIPDYGFYAVGATGLISMFFMKNWIRAIVKTFKKKKYEIAAGFREN